MFLYLLSYGDKVRMNIYGKICVIFAVLALVFLFITAFFDVKYLWLTLLFWICFYIFGKISSRADYVDWMSRAGNRGKVKK